MCGIFGILNLDGRPVDPTVLRTMADRMVHRGPDDEGFWHEGSVGLGMRRLAIIDLAGGHQPITNETGDVQVVLNGEIYNYAALRVDLVQRGHRFASKSDVEVLVHLYEDAGRECIHALNGMFAFALYDRKRRSLWVARDRLGIKPLYFCHTPQRFVFASDLNALNAVVRAPISASSLAAYLGYSYIPAPRTPYENVQKLLPGEELVIHDGNLTRSRYWRLGDSETLRVDANAAASALEDLLVDAVKLEMQSDVPVGVFLSGGLDSSAVASFAAGHARDHAIRTYTIDFHDKEGDDARCAALVSRELSSDHHEIRVSAQDQFDALQQLMPFLDEPMADSAIVPTYILSRAAREQGVKVLLTGAGGDEIFGGYPRHYPGKLGSAAWFAALPSFSRRLLKPAWQLWNPALAIRLDNPARNFAITISGTNLAFLHEALRPRELFDEMLHGFGRDFWSADSCRSYPRMRLDLEHYLPDNILALTDKATMAASVEGRVPLLDHRLVELAFSIPEAMNISGGTPKGLFRNVLSQRLPAAILNRRKEGFNAPIHQWVEKWPLEIRDELLGNTAPLLRDMFDIKALEKWLDRPHLRRRAAESLYSLFVLNCWMTTHRAATG